jgi:hypothetical protein
MFATKARRHKIYNQGTKEELKDKTKRIIIKKEKNAIGGKK